MRKINIYLGNALLFLSALFYISCQDDDLAQVGDLPDTNLPASAFTTVNSINFEFDCKNEFSVLEYDFDITGGTPLEVNAIEYNWQIEPSEGVELFNKQAILLRRLIDGIRKDIVPLENAKKELEAKLPCQVDTEIQDQIDVINENISKAEAELTDEDKLEIENLRARLLETPIASFSDREFIARFPNPGTYELTLIVTDNLGQTSEAKTTISFEEPEKPSDTFIPNPIILEPGFEDNSLPTGTGDGRDSWRLPSGFDGGGVIQINSKSNEGTLPEGKQAAKFPSDGSRNGYQKIAVTKNASYVLTYSYNLKTSPSGGSLTVSVLNGNVSNANEIVANTIASTTGTEQLGGDIFTSERIEFESGDNDSVIIYIANENAEARVDDFRITAVQPTNKTLPEIFESSFEDNSLPDGTGDGRDSWRSPSGFGGGSVFQINSKSNEGTLPDGKQAAKFPSDGSRLGFQEITVDKDTDYILSYEYNIKTDPTGGSITVDILNGGVTSNADVSSAIIQTKISTEQLGGDTFILETIEFNSGDNDSVIIHITNENAEARIDNFKIRFK